MHNYLLRLASVIGISAVGLVMGTSLALASDTTRPTVGAVSPTSATVGTPVTITTTYSDNDSGVASCELYVEFQNAGAMTLSNGIASKVYTFTGKGVYTVFVHCKDAANNPQNGAYTAVDVAVAAGSSDSTAPTIGVISPNSATKGTAVTLSATYSDASGVSSCKLIISGFDVGSMTLSNGVASKSYTFDNAASATAYAQCSDTVGNTGVGATTTITVTTASSQAPEAETPAEDTPAPASASTVAPGLVKLACVVSAGTDDPCHAVYYRASDGTRHAFPNSSVFFTWYSDFSTVTEISSSAMAALPIGHNVTYRPGVRMVKFTTENKVYAVSDGGILRWVSSEAVAVALYGNDWNKKIDDIADTFYKNYTKGSDITSASDYSPSTATTETQEIEDNF